MKTMQRQRKFSKQSGWADRVPTTPAQARKVARAKARRDEVEAEKDAVETRHRQALKDIQAADYRAKQEAMAKLGKERDGRKDRKQRRSRA